MPVVGVIALAASAAALAMIGVAVSMGIATSKAVESIGRQPEASGKINSSLMFGLIMMETTAIYALLIAILLVFVLGGNAGS